MPVNIQYLVGQRIVRMQRLHVSPASEGDSYACEGLLLSFADESRVLLQAISRGKQVDGKWLCGVEVIGLGDTDKDLLLIGPHEVLEDTSPGAARDRTTQVTHGAARPALRTNASIEAPRLSPWWPASPQGRLVYWLIMALAFAASTIVVSGGVPALLENLNYMNGDLLAEAFLWGGALSAASWYVVLTITRAIYLAIVQR